MINVKLVYPERQRCAKCRQYFAWIVVAGLYDSRSCAGLPPIGDPEEWPRQHYSKDRITGLKKEKRDFESEISARRAAKKHKKEAYRCGYCLGWHIGSLNPDSVIDPPLLEIVS